ncbi:hypothetical protein N7457_001330, partial [Penicillium paradoxum]|uniref:uncharacterized protein n=1 Tax=Penicillium paradoxum TaxID=176176 RepID=UPI002548FC35
SVPANSFTRPTDVFIAVMGVTGSGKSSFISLCSGKSVEIGHSLNACTAKVDVYAYKLSADRTVYLIDTPGFDDTSKKDTEVLSEIATWLGDSYSSKIKLNGIIYLHRISDRRMQGSARRNLQMFRDLCGDDALKKVILATTMWDIVPTAEGDMREKELKENKDFWGYMLSKGSIALRHDNTSSSARDIVQQLAIHKKPIVTDIQKQLVDQKLPLDQTAAGMGLQSETLKERARWMKERQEFEAELRAAKREQDREREEIMREERDRRAEMIKKADRDMAALRSDMEKLLAQRDEREALLERRMEERLERKMQRKQAEYDKEIQRLRMEREAELQKAKEQEQQAERGRKKLEQKKKTQKEKAEQKTKDNASQVNRQSQSTPANVAGYSPYSVTMGSQLCAVSGPKSYLCSTKGWPKMQVGSEWIGAVSFGNSNEWIARYGAGTWKYPRLENYPHLAGKLSLHGARNLEFCVLGPGQTYYARWLDGTWSSMASEHANSEIRELASRPNNSRIRAMAFGYNESYVISFGQAEGSTVRGTWGNRWYLKGYYPDLCEFAVASSPLSIVVSLRSCLDYSSAG